MSITIDIKILVEQSAYINLIFTENLTQNAKEIDCYDYF